jgi:hypothetical protein
VAGRREQPRAALHFEEGEMRRIRWCLSVTGQTYQEFMETAVMQAVDEVEGEERELMTRRRLAMIEKRIIERHREMQ